jgi:hypothetical protein
MRIIGLNTGFPGLAFIALMVGAAACSSATTISETIGETAPGEVPPDGTTTNDKTTNDKTTNDPSTKGDPTSKDSPAPPLVTGLAITDVAFFQGVKVPVIKAGKVVGKTTRNAPVVAGRPALVRVYVAMSEGYAPSAVTAELRLFDGTTSLPVIKDTKSIVADSTDEIVESTFNFEVPAESLPAGVTYQVFLTTQAGVVPTGAVKTRIPSEGGVQDLEVETSGKLKIVVVPVKYDADGSGRLPDVSATQLALLKSTFMSLYAVTDVDITTRAPFSYPNTISADGSGFPAVLNAITNLRKSDGAASDVYYYGAFAPQSSLRAYCGGGCVTGLSTVVDSPKTSSLRASVGVGFSGPTSANTAAHEVGHAHGRYHAPCGNPALPDPAFPYSGGAIGTWGYDILQKTFISPTTGKDMMGYCSNEWVSDYTFAALFDRVAVVNGGVASAGSGGSGNRLTQENVSSPVRATHTFRTATVEGDGSVAWGGDFELDEEPTDGEQRSVTYLSASGRSLSTDTAHFYAYDHLPGGVLVVPVAPKAETPEASATLQNAWSQVRISGLANTLAR